MQLGHLKVYQSLNLPEQLIKLYTKIYFYLLAINQCSGAKQDWVHSYRLEQNLDRTKNRFTRSGFEHCDLRKLTCRGSAAATELSMTLYWRSHRKVYSLVAVTLCPTNKDNITTNRDVFSQLQSIICIVVNLCAVRLTI